MILFYAPDIEENPSLPDVESSHCCRVLRMKSGDEIFVTDGRGNLYKCIITKADPAKTILSIVDKEDRREEKDYKLTLAVAPTKNPERIEWLVEKAVEIGVDKIVLLKCRRSERKFQKTERLKKVMISAMKQSLSLTLPEITELTDIKDFIKESGNCQNKYFGYCSELYPRKEFVKEYKEGGEVIVMIGPEGDFSPEEVELAVGNGFQPVTFGEKRLRTETAGVFAVCAVNIINQMND